MGKSGLSRLVLTGLLLSYCSVSAQDKKASHLTISYPSISGAQAVLWIAKETGIFQKNGLDIDLVYISGGPRSVAALLSSQLQVIGTGGDLSRLCRSLSPESAIPNAERRQDNSRFFCCHHYAGGEGSRTRSVRGCELCAGA